MSGDSEFHLEPLSLEAFFPAEWGDDDGFGGPAPADAGTLYLCAWDMLQDDDMRPNTFESSDKSCVIARTSLAEIVSGLIENTRGSDGTIDGNYSAGLRRIAEALRAAASELDAALNRTAT